MFAALTPRIFVKATMPVDSTHLDYDANAAAWLRARDVFAGEDAVKAAWVANGEEALTD